MHLLQEKMNLLNSSSSPPSPSSNHHYEGNVDLKDSSYNSLNKPQTDRTSTYPTLWRWCYCLESQTFYTMPAFAMPRFAIPDSIKDKLDFLVQILLLLLVQPKFFELIWVAVLRTTTTVLLSNEKKDWLCEEKNWLKLAFTLEIITFARALNLLIDLLDIMIWVIKLIMAIIKDTRNDPYTNEAFEMVNKAPIFGTFEGLFRAIALDILIPVLVIFMFINTPEQHCEGVPKVIQEVAIMVTGNPKATTLVGQISTD